VVVRGCHCVIWHGPCLKGTNSYYYYYYYCYYYYHYYYYYDHDHSTTTTTTSYLVLLLGVQWLHKTEVLFGMDSTQDREEVLAWGKDTHSREEEHGSGVKEGDFLVGL